MEKVIFLRPLGGFNDTLCRIARGLEFAQRTGRDLIIDTTDSGLMGEFDTYLTFHHASTSVKVTTRIDETLLSSLDHLAAFPRFINQDISLSQLMSLSRGERLDVARSHDMPSFRVDLTKDYSEDLVFFEGGGGGQASFRVLKHLSVSEPIREMLNDFSQSLPPEYLAAHVRATDYRADADYFLRRLGRIGKSRKVYLASDNHEVFEKAQNTYLPDRLVNKPVISTFEAGRSKHQKRRYQSESEMRAVTEQMFRDLFALSGASRLYYPLLDPSTTERGLTKASGFSLLARHIGEKPAIFTAFFHVERPTARPRLPYARILAPVRPQFIYWKRRPFRHLPDSLRLTKRLRAILQNLGNDG